MNQKVSKAEAIPCTVLTFTDEEMNAINQMLSDEGYETGSAGLKSWIIDCAYDDSEESNNSTTDTVMDNLREYLEKNPAMAMQFMSMAENGIGTLLTGIKSRLKKKG